MNPLPPAAEPPPNTALRLEIARFRPRLLDALQHYSRARLLRDIAAGITVAFVALPLAMAFAIASGLPPQAGLATAVIAGFLISALGGSAVQIGGPAGAYIVVVYAIVERYGIPNLLIATLMAGGILFLMGLFKLGALVRFVPVAVVIGFTNGIAVLIALSQVKDFLGLRVDNLPADFFGKLNGIFTYAHTANPAAIALASSCLALIVAWQFAMPTLAGGQQLRGKLTVIPGTIVALVAATVATVLLELPVDTIGSRFGGVPQALPSFALPAFSWETVKTLLPPAMTIAALGAIESLLCARVADNQMQARGKDKHDPNQELMAQGLANAIMPFFGGMPATGTIARTVTNIKSGATSPVAGMVHALVLFIILLAAAPLANHIPLAALAAILMYVAWNMGQWHEFPRLKQFKLTYRLVLVGTFLLTVIFDLTVAVQVGLVLACVIFIYRISSLTHIEPADQHAYPVLRERYGQVRAWRLYGALFFGAVHHIEALAEHLPREALILDFKNVLYVDSTGLESLKALHAACAAAGVRLLICGLHGQPHDMLARGGLLEDLGADNIASDLAGATGALAGQD